MEQVTLENYEVLRNQLVEANSNCPGVVLREKEVRLNDLLTRLKKHLSVDCGGKIPYSFPVLTDRRLRESALYRFCSLLPKGADLHVHDMALLPAKELIPLLKTRAEFCIHLGSEQGEAPSYRLAKVAPGEAIPAGYRRFREALESGMLTEDELLTNWTVAGAAASGKEIWDYFEGLFDRHEVLSCNPEFAAVYYDRAFRYYCEHHITHVEIHLMLTESIEESEEYLKMLRGVYYRVKEEYPYFTVRVIGAGAKADNENIELTKRCFLNTSYVQETVLDESDPTHPVPFVIGFDLVNEEDSSLPLRAFAPMLLKVKKQYPTMGLYIHGGESINTGNDNLIDAYLLGVSRVGHGLNLYRYPDLHARYIKSEICLEVCPISNQSLGYTKDLRNHPATEYLRSGVAMALCSDDPAYMENETLTDDFFAATVSWDLSVADLKQLGIHSILYSGLAHDEKYRSLRGYQLAWEQFVDRFISEISC